MCIKINKVSKQEVGIRWVQKCLSRYGVPIWSLWPNIRFLPSIVAEKNVTKNVHICSMCIKNQLSRQTGSRNLMGPKTLPTIWGTYMTLVTKYQISAINSYWEKCDEKYLGRKDRGKTVYPPPPSGSGGIINKNIHIILFKLLLHSDNLKYMSLVKLIKTTELQLSPFVKMYTFTHSNIHRTFPFIACLQHQL
jgi:hypothetical protein